MATTYLTSGNLSSAGNQKKWTFSAWIKKSTIGVDNGIFSFWVNSTNYFQARFRSEDDLVIGNKDGGSWTLDLIPNRKLRDTNGFYHIVLQYDSAQATSSDRASIWINGEKQTSFATSVYPSQNANTKIPNSGYPIEVGRAKKDSNTYYANGAMSHVHFCDGYAYAASDFGEEDASTGEWKIKTSPSVSYGTNGFFILKDGNSVTDQSGEGNNFTVGGGTLTNTEDCPSDVFCTMNRLATSSYSTLENGNTTSKGNTNSDNGNSFGTLVPNKGKFYCEVKVTKEGTGYPSVGLAQASDANFGNCKNSSAGMAGYNTAYSSTIRPDGQRVQNNSTSSWTSTTFDTNDVLMLAMDCDNGACYIGKNGTWIESGDPTSGGTKTGAFQTWTPTSHTAGQTFAIRDYDISVAKWNFGNGYFGTTAISSEGTNASSIGKFEFDVPANYTALSLKGMNS